MRERLLHTVRVRLPPHDYQNLLSVPGNRSEFIRGAIREAILVRRSVNPKVNSENRQDFENAGPGDDDRAEK